MTVRQIRIIGSDPERVVWAEAGKADRYVSEGRAVYVDKKAESPPSDNKGAIQTAGNKRRRGGR